MDIQKRLAMHSSAVLLRRKPAAMFLMPRQEEWGAELRQVLQHHALRCDILCDRCHNALLLVYDPAMLADRMEEAVVRETLKGLGYPVGKPLAEMLGFLRGRAADQGGFPHEIGFFLGYPVEDVLGFMKHRGKRCKLCGLWKVYGDVSAATAMFEELCACRQRVMNHLQSGGTLYTLPAALAG